MPLILTELKDRIGTIQFNNPEKRNCLSNSLLQEMVAAFEQFAEKKVRVVVIRAQPGAKVWSSGFDVTELPDPGRDPLSYYDPLVQVMREIQYFPAPVLAMIEGGVWGGACDLSLTCDIAIGSPSASFTMTPARLGLPYNSAGIVHFLNVVGIRIAREMFFTAQPILAERALQVGMLNHLVPAEVLEAYTYDSARKMAENSPLSIAVLKEQLRILGGSHPVSPDTFERIQALRRRAYDSNDYQEGKTAFLEKRNPVFTGE